MRIVAGKYKGKKLLFPKNDAVRPTADMVKEALFTKLFDAIPNSNFLDLFCGSGQIGIEALSRDAKKVVFVDNNHESISVTKKNLEGLEGDFEVVKAHFASFLQKTTNTFDVVFIDPPYKEEKFYFDSLKTINERNLLNKNGIIVLETERNFVLNQDFFDVFDKKQYGIKNLLFLSLN